MPGFEDLMVATRAVLDPTTPGTDLLAIVQTQPHLWGQVAAHPNAYPQLLDWLATNGDATVKQAIAARRSSDSATADPWVVPYTRGPDMVWQTPVAPAPVSTPPPIPASRQARAATITKQRHFPIWGGVSIVALIVAAACIVWFVVIPRNNVTSPVPSKPDLRTAPVWGPVVDVTEGLPPQGLNFYSSTTYDSGDLVIADVKLGPFAGSNAVSEYLRGIDARTSAILWTLDLASFNVPPNAPTSLAIDTSTNTAFLAWVNINRCYLAFISLTDGTVTNRSTTGLASPILFDTVTTSSWVQARGGILLVSIPMETNDSDATQFNLFGFSAKDLDQPLWQRQANTYGYFIEDKWVCDDGCWSAADGSKAPFGADATTGNSSVYYESFQDAAGNYRTYRVSLVRPNTSLSTWQEWSTSNDNPVPNTKVVPFSGRFDALQGANRDTLLLCQGQLCTPESMDGNQSYPPFQAFGNPGATELSGYLIVYDTSPYISVPSAAMLVSLTSGQKTILGFYGYCRASNDLAYCSTGGQGLSDPRQIEAIDPAKGATPVWSTTPDQQPSLDGKYYGWFDFTDTTVYYNDNNNHLQFASRF